MIHELKITEKYYRDIWSGAKEFELRKNDRNFKRGDELILKEYNQFADFYTGNEIRVRVIYILKGGKFGLKKGHCIMGIRKTKQQ